MNGLGLVDSYGELCCAGDGQAALNPWNPHTSPIRVELPAHLTGVLVQFSGPVNWRVRVAMPLVLTG